MSKLLFLTSAVLLLASCNDKKAAIANNSSNSDSTKMMNNDEERREQRNIQTIRSLVQAANSHDADELVAAIAPDAVDYGDGTMPPLKSKDSIKAATAQLFKSIPDYKGENFDYYANGNTVIVIGDWSGTFKNDMGNIKATGKSFKYKNVDIFKLNNDGQLTEHRSIYPVEAALAGRQK